MGFNSAFKGLNDLSRNNSAVGDSDGSDYEFYRPLGWTA